jgi:membrane protease YdiL (CAAX protease family)
LEGEMMNSSIDKIRGFEWITPAVLFLVVGGLIGASAYVAYLPAQLRIALRILMPVITLAGWLISARVERLQKYQGLASGFFAVSLGLLLAYFVGGLPLKWLNLSPTTIKGMAVAKLSETLPIMLSILVLHFARGGLAEGLFLRAGRLKVGLISTAVGVVIMLSIASLQALGLGLTWARIAPALPWILIFIFSNAFLEELWFRGLFLKKLEPLTGKISAILLTSLVFGLVHISSTYVIEILSFVGVTFGLGVLWSWLMFKSDSIWPAVVIHAAADVLVMIGFLA